jgi:hypothetical protein
LRRFLGEDNFFEQHLTPLLAVLCADETIHREKLALEAKNVSLESPNLVWRDTSHLRFLALLSQQLAGDSNFALQQFLELRSGGR